MKKFLENLTRKVWLEGDPSKDCTVVLTVFGALEILLGLLFFSFAMLLLLMVSAIGLHGVKPIHYWMAMGFLLYLTGWFVVMGLGSIKAKRWARALLLVGAWTSVFFGTLMLALVLYVLPEVYTLLADSGLMPPMVALGIVYTVVLVLILLQVVLPLLSILFYGLKSVEATCERRNPARCWTDRCPLPLLAMSFISGLGCLSIVMGATTNFIVLLFGHILSGVPGALILAIISIASGYVGWGAYTRKMHAWWGAYALIVLTSASMMLTFSEVDMHTLYARMGYTVEQIPRLQELFPFNAALLTFLSCLWGIMACAYLVWVRDCFFPKKIEVEVKSYERKKTEKEAASPMEPPRPRMRLD
jgi:hypothetical protein